jgi:DNA-binding transcriptional LysR family regulator
MQLSDRVGRRMKLHDLHVLLAVAQAGSMSKAAQLLNTTQPAISKSIADLEHAIGVRLLDRGRHGAEPTAYGRALLDGGTAMFDDLRQAVKNIEFLADPTVGEVRVMANEPIIIGVIAAVLDRLRQTHPGISVHVTPIVADAQRSRDLRERRFDLFVGRVDSPFEQDLSVEVLFHDRLKIVVGAKSKWARRHGFELSELANEPWILPRQDAKVAEVLADAFRARGANFPPKGVVWGHASLICAVLQRGNRLGTLPTSLLQFGGNVPQLKVLPLDLAITPWPIGVITLKNRTLTPVVKIFIDCMREVVKPLARKK